MRNVRRRRILLCLSRTALHAPWRRSNRLQDITAGGVNYDDVWPTDDLITACDTHTAEPAADRADSGRCDTPACTCARHSWVKRHTLCHTAEVTTDRSAWADWEERHDRKNVEENKTMWLQSYTDTQEHKYLVLPQTQDFVTKAGHDGQGPGWHKLKNIVKKY